MKLSASRLSFGWDLVHLQVFGTELLKALRTANRDFQYNIYCYILYVVKNILLYCNKCIQQLLLLFVPAFNYLGGWVVVMVVVLAGQRAQCWVCPYPHWRAASNTAVKLFWNERIKHTFLCWNIFTKHHSFFLILGGQNDFVTLSAGALPGCLCPLCWGHMGHLQVKLLWSAFARSRNYVAVVWSNEKICLKACWREKGWPHNLYLRWATPSFHK